MSGSDRRSYLTATAITQTFLNNCQDNLENRLEMIVEIETPSGTIYASDRNKYVGSVFYEALLNFPVIRRIVGEWLSNELVFSTLQLEISNTDGRFNEFLPGGASYDGWIGRRVEVKLGLGEQAATYNTIFSGHVTDVGGFKRGIKSITVIARDDYEKINVNFPLTTFSDVTYPKIGNNVLGKFIPVVYGDWTSDTEPSPAGVICFVVNGNDPFLHYTAINVEITAPGSPALFTRLDHDLDDGDIIRLETSGTLPLPFFPGIDYFVRDRTADTFHLAATLAGVAINATTAGAGTHRFIASPTATHENVKLIVSENANTLFDSDNVYLKRNDQYWLIPNTEIANLNGDNNYFEILQNTATLWLDGSVYTFQQGDVFLVRIKGKDLTSYDDNPVWQARDLLLTYGGLVSGDFDSNWATYRDATTAVSRIYVAESQSVLQYALSILEQVLLEAFIDKNLKLKINSLRFADWVSAPSHTIKNWDIEAGSFATSVDERNNFNRAQAAYAFLPEKNENAYVTSVYKNQDSIDQMGKAISKKVVYPNLYKLSDVVYYLGETLKLASSALEIITANLTWRSLLKDIGDFVLIDVKIGASQFDNVPCMIREIGYDPTGLKLPVKLWCMTLVPFPGYVPGYFGTKGGYNATIDEEI